jgi:hypothetical protein
MEAIMWGAVIAFGVITACAGAIREVAAAEAALITAPVTRTQPPINRPQPAPLEPDAQLKSREQLKDAFFRTALIG